MSREDLRALSPQSLAALSNLGLVKRAQREAEQGKAPRVEELADGTVVGTSEDGAVARLLLGRSLKDCPCTCGATAVCRHRVATVLAYAATGAPAQAAPEAAWSPGALDDETLARLLPRRELERAETQRRAGYVAQVRRGTFASDDVPTVALATCTVRFLVPREPSHVRCDCAGGSPCEHLALAVWAFREADRSDTEARELAVGVGGEAASPGAGALEAALAVGRLVLLEGAVHASAGVAGRFALARGGVERAGMTWVRAVLEDVEDALSAYHARSARYSPVQLSGLLAELFARVRAGLRPGVLPAKLVLGTDEAAETRLEHLRLVSLGARVSGVGSERRVEVMLVDPAAAGLLVLRRTFTAEEGKPAEDGPGLALRQGAGGTNLGTLAHGQLVTSGATRRPDRLVVLGTRGLQRTSVMPQTGAWGELPSPVLVREVAHLVAALRERPPRFVRPRLRAERVHAFAVGGVMDVGYVPGAQALRARLTDATGGEFVLRLSHRQVAPGALEALASGLAGTYGAPRFVSGEARLEGGMLIVEPLALACEGGRVVVLDFQAPSVAFPAHTDEEAGPPGALAAVLREVEGCLAEAAHQGLRHVSPPWQVRRAEVEARARAVGLTQLAERLQQLGVRYTAARTTGGPEESAALAEAWSTAAVRTAVALEQVGADGG